MGRKGCRNPSCRNPGCHNRRCHNRDIRNQDTRRRSCRTVAYSRPAGFRAVFSTRCHGQLLDSGIALQAEYVAPQLLVQTLLLELWTHQRAVVVYRPTRRVVAEQLQVRTDAGGGDLSAGVDLLGRRRQGKRTVRRHSSQLTLLIHSCISQ